MPGSDGHPRHFHPCGPAPEAFETIEVALLRIKDVHYQVATIN
jgi:hypothetical protein